MPFKSEQKGLIIPKHLNKNVKLSEEDKKQIVEIRKNTGLSYQKIGNQFGVSKKRIIQICNPEIEKREKEQMKERQKDGRYYNKEKHKIYMKNHRRYKQELYNNNLLENKND